MNRFLYLIGIGISLICSAANASNVRASGATVVVNEVPALKFRASFGGLSSMRRAERLVSVLRGMESIEDIHVRRVNHRSFDVMASGRSLLRLGPLDAKACATPVATLARRWAAQLISAFALPALSLADHDIILPPAGIRTVRLIGSGVPTCIFSTSDPKVVSVCRVLSGVRITTHVAGEAKILVESNGASESLNVEVRPYAASFPQSVSGVVAGEPATTSTVTRTIEGAIRSQLIVRPEARVSIGTIRSAHVRGGHSKVFRVRIAVTAPGSFPRSGIAVVSIRNIGGLARNDAELWYSNDPEGVTKAGSLFSGKLRRSRPVRLLYHHYNQASQAMFLRVQAVNNSEVAAHVVLIPGDSTPDKNPVQAGLNAANQYLPAWLWGSGEVVTIPPKSSLPISLRRFSPGETVSGLCSLRLLDGPEDLLIRTDAWPPFTVDQRWVAALGSSTPWQEVGAHLMTQYDTAPYERSTSIYPNPLRVENLTYQVGGRYGFVRIGQSPISREDNERPLDGNFGVVYVINAHLENPTSIKQNLELIFESSAGYSGAIFSVNGQILQTPLLQPKEEARIIKISLNPGAVCQLELITIPLSGGSYPATITIRPVQPNSHRLRFAR